MLIKLKDLYERFFAGTDTGQTCDQFQFASGTQTSDVKILHGDTHSDQPRTTKETAQ
jgi:hypothetical protein